MIAIIGILIALLLPAVQAAREAARRMSCSNNLKQLGMGILNYDSTHRTFPFSINPLPEGDQTRVTPQRNAKGWIIGVLPFLEQQDLYDQFAPGFEGDFYSGGGIMNPLCRDAMRTQLSVLQCPSDPSPKTSTQQYQWTDVEVALTNYKGVIGDTRIGGNASVHQGTMPDCHNKTGCNGLFYRCNYQEPIRINDISDGTSNTFMVGEDVPAHNRHSTAYYANGDYSSCHAALNYMPNPPTPGDWWNVISFRSLHPGGAHFCMVDGSVHFVTEDIDYTLYRHLSTKGGEPGWGGGGGAVVTTVTTYWPEARPVPLPVFSM